MSIFQLMVRRLSEMTLGEFEHACDRGYVTINTSPSGRDPLGWWVPTRISAAMLSAARELRPLIHQPS